MPLLYGVVLNILGMIFEQLTIWSVDKYNIRFYKDYNDAIANQLFVFNCLNSYVPLIYVAFFKQNYQALFTMLFIMLVFDQWRTAFVKAVKPCWYKAKKSTVMEREEHNLKSVQPAA